METTLSPNETLKIITGIRSRSPFLKAKAIESFPKIAQILGEERTSEELFPFYVHTTNLTETELVKMIDKFGEIDYQNFSQNSIKIILNFIKELTEIDSTQVRNALSVLFQKIISNLPKDSIPDIFYQYLIDLIDSEYCPQQITCFTIISQIGEYLSMDLFNEIISNFSNLESNPEQSKAALIKAANSMIIYANNDEFTSQMEEYLNEMFENSQKNPLICKSFLYLIKENKKLSEEFVMNIIDSMIESFNKLDFRVQIALIQTLSYIQYLSYSDRIMKLIQIKQATSNDIILVQICVELQSPVIQSTENNNDLQTASKLVESIIEEFLGSPYVPLCVQALQELKYLVPLLDRNFTITVLSKYLSSDNPDIYLAALGTLSCDFFTKNEKLPIIKHALQKMDWRGRHAIASNVQLMQDMTILEDMLFDDAFAVRMKAIHVAKEINEEVGSNSWFKENIDPIIKKLLSSSDYQMRQTGLTCIYQFGADKFDIELLENAAKDSVSNVRATVAKIAKELRIDNIIQLLQKDEDPIVQEILCTK